ncbi:MAG: LamG-like jellyroll fold domain-containing protein, partial [Pseudohongiellaceae bacterium]
ENGNTIDYLSVANYIGQQDTNCTPAFDWTAASTNSHTIARFPDGTGDWLPTGSGKSGDDTEEGTNDTDDDGNPYPTITVTNVTVAKGETAEFVLTVEGDPVRGYAVEVDYQTVDATAVAGVDYDAESGTAIIPDGTSSFTVTVNTIADSPSGVVYFYLYLNDPVNGTIENHYPTGTILGPALAQWNMDQSVWSGTTDEVVDSSGNDYHGTANNGAITNDNTPAIPGSPGTCRYGTFDGSNDYIALPGFPDLTGSFTITTWINPHDIGNDQRIFADDENNSGGYAFSLGDGGDGRLRFFSRNVSPVSLDSPVVISANSWHHVAAVHNSHNKTRQIYVNGQLVAS